MEIMLLRMRGKKKKKNLIYLFFELVQGKPCACLSMLEDWRWGGVWYYIYQVEVWFSVGEFFSIDLSFIVRNFPLFSVETDGILPFKVHWIKVWKLKSQLISCGIWWSWIVTIKRVQAKKSSNTKNQKLNSQVAKNHG